mgnify:FL=1|jgi:hypothetical protein|tara:strand:- start:110 stop:1042 length:933 start_codon:yes stop_codon:yes gene_type:complete
MGAVTGMGDSYDLPNYVGELFNITPNDTPFLSMMGGMTGGKSVTSKQFTWQTVDNAAAAQTAVVEGADPSYAERSRSEVVNVTQIMQYGVQVSYTKQAATGNLSGQAIIGNQPVQDELAFQLDMALKRAARDIEFTCMQGTYVADTDVSTARKTRGLGAALTTNKINAGGDALTQADIDNALKSMADNGAPFENVVLFANAANKQLISSFYSNSLALAPRDRNIGGVNINTIETDFCEMGVVYERHIPATQVFLIDMNFCKPVFLDIPGKGHFFVEPLAQSGAAYKYQVYGEFGLEYGPEQFHGNIHSTA